MAVRNRLLSLISEKQAQTNRRITQEEVANAVGLSRQTLNKWVTNKVESYPKDTLDKFCKYFDCGVGDILIYERDE
jgi:putative transcriptional regulator